MSVNTPISANPGATLKVDNTKGFGKLFLDKSGSTTDNKTDLDNNVNLNGGGLQRTFEVGVASRQGRIKRRTRRLSSSYL